MSERKHPIEVRSARDGVTLTVRRDGAPVAHKLTFDETSDLVAMLLKAGVASYLATHDVGAPDHRWPMSTAADVYMPVAWPLTVALTAPASDEGRPAIGLAAAYGDVQVVVGIQRNQLRRLAEIMLEMDRRLPPSDHFELGLG